jgi:hypothetical protein
MLTVKIIIKKYVSMERITQNLITESLVLHKNSQLTGGKKEMKLSISLIKL